MKRSPALLLLLCLLLVFSGCDRDKSSYTAAQALMDSGDYLSAEAAFRELGAYRDAPEKADACRYTYALARMEHGDYAGAAEILTGLGTYSNAAELVKECRYQPALQLMEQGAYREAADAFALLAGYKDADAKKLECENSLKYIRAAEALQAGRDAQDTQALETARALFSELGSFRDSAARMQECAYLAAGRLAAAPVLSLQDCQRIAALYREAGDYDGAALSEYRRMNRLTLWTYVRETGSDGTDGDGTPCKTLELYRKNAPGGNDVETEETLTVYAYTDQTLALSRTQAYASGDATYTETLCVMFDISSPRKASVCATSYTDLGVYGAYISEVFRGGTNPESLRTRADIVMISYLQQARLLSGKNTQSSSYADQKSIEKVLFSVPDFILDFDSLLSMLPCPLSMEGMGFGVSDAAPGTAGDFTGGQIPGPDPLREPELYVPADEERFKSEQPVLCICATGAPVRKGPSNTYGLVCTMPLGETLQASAVSDGWLYVRYNKREYGWIDMAQLFGEWMFKAGINPALSGITPPKKYAETPTVIETTDKANARTSPDAKSGLVGSYIPGSAGVYIGSTESWYLVNYDGTYGWVHKNNFK